MRLWNNDKVVFQAHALRRGAARKLQALTLAEQVRSSISQLHPSKVDTETRCGARTKGAECGFCGGSELSAFHPAGRIKPVGGVSMLACCFLLY